MLFLLSNHIMLPSIITILLFLLGLLCSFIHLHRQRATSSRPKLPPGPQPLPIIGNLHMLGNLPHRSLRQLAKKYGDIMYMRLGCVPTIVVSSPQAAELFLKTHDAIFANRPKVQAYEFLSYGAKAIAFTEYGPYWRNVRRLCTVELLSSVKVESLASMRREEIGLLVQSLKKSAAAKEVADVSAKVSEVIEDTSYRMVFGRSKDDRYDLKAIIQEGTRLAGAFNIADYLPWLAVLDLQGLARRMKALSKFMDKILDKIIDKHEQEASEHQSQHGQDFIDVMLSLTNKSIHYHNEQSFMIDRTNIKAIILDMLVGSIESTAIVIEWALSELLRHPRVMRRLQEELESVVGTNRMVEETDLSKLVYLDMVMKETLRLHVSPFLVPHESMEDIMINGYQIPKKSTIIINAWAIARDPDVWSDNAEEFLPERFMGSNIDLRGRDFRLIPFGSGRRGCPGIQLGLIHVRLVLAQLVHCFEWELPNGMLPNELDMSEKFGLTMPRAKHLLALPTYRLLVKDL
ncbi:hypothetical protein L1049_027691 [Liquidambar formosana]|uniref:Cytochrome P450 n=1 Tax=Liquidambar formosana TaxID=63359 RepID=A0AAP0RJ77_LIQFO